MARVTGSLNHTHQYYRREDGRWACARDTCTHFMPKNMSPRPAGSKSLCWSCQKEFILTPMDMVDDRPMCEVCTEQIEQINAHLPIAPKKVDFMSPEHMKSISDRAKAKIDEPTNEE